MKTRYSILALCTVMTFALGCASDEAEPEAADELVAVTKSEEIKALDAMVDEINGYRSLDDYIEIAPKAFPPDLPAMVKPACPLNGRLSESGARYTRVSSSTKKIRQLDRSWIEYGAKERIQVEESAIFDDAGRLRVVVLDAEIDHIGDATYMAGIAARNAERQRKLVTLNEQLAKQPDNSLFVARLNLVADMENRVTVEQRRFYFSVSGVQLLETVRRGLEHSYLSSQGRWHADDTPPTVYNGRRHPTAAKGRWRTVAWSGQPIDELEVLPEVSVSTRLSWRSKLVTPPADSSPHI